MTPDQIGIIIQARMGSTRLPGKILLRIGDHLLLEHILLRLATLRRTVTTVIATSDTTRDDVVAEFCAAHSVNCFRGSEQNVLDRYYQCARAYNFQHIIRLTGDNPFPDIEELDQLITLHLAGHFDYSNSFANLPVGVGAEIFTFAALQQSWQQGKEAHHLEHVNEYMLEHPEIFATALLTVGTVKNKPHVRLTVDTADDYQRACYIVQASGMRHVATPQAIALAEEFTLKAIPSC